MKKNILASVVRDFILIVVKVKQRSDCSQRKKSAQGAYSGISF